MSFWFRIPVVFVALKFCLFPALPLHAANNVSFESKPDPLNAGNKLSVMITDSKQGRYGQSVAIAVYATCNDVQKRITVGFVPGDVIFPSTEYMTTATVLRTRIRYKFDTDSDGTDAIWTTTNDYKTILTAEKSEEFTRKLGSANTLSARIGDTNIDITISLSGTKASIEKILSQCGTFWSPRY